MIVHSLREHFQKMVDGLTAEAFEYAEAGADACASDALNDAAIYKSVVQHIDEQSTTLDFVFARGGDDSFDLAFVEVEDEHGRSVRAGHWMRRPDGFDVLRIDVLAQQVQIDLPDDDDEPFEEVPELLTDQEQAYVDAVAAVDRIHVKGGHVYVGRWPRRKKFSYAVATSASAKVGP